METREGAVRNGLTQDAVSTGRAPTSRARLATLRLLGRPALDLRPQPELDAAIPEIDDRAWHVGVAALVEADAVAMRQSKNFGHRLRIKQVLGGDSGTHRKESTYVDGSVRIGS